MTICWLGTGRFFNEKNWRADGKRTYLSYKKKSIEFQSAGTRQKTNNYRNHNNRRACHYAWKKFLLSGKGQIFYDNIGTGRWATAHENLVVNDPYLWRNGRCQKRLYLKKSLHARTKNLLTGQGQIFTRKINRAGGQRDYFYVFYRNYDHK